MVVGFLAQHALLHQALAVGPGGHGQIDADPQAAAADLADGGLVAGVDYHYTVAAYDNATPANQSAPTAELHITP